MSDKKSKLERRDFLKILSGMIAGGILWPLRIFKKDKTIREAKYYTTGDDLAG